ncbi:MAG TPA: hypothetical protein VHO24_07550 [Opitutaceae bacterium]|nr:hypothetical protein [Opitutaceae bacterium]
MNRNGQTRGNRFSVFVAAILALLGASVRVGAAAETGAIDSRWWPTQVVPKGIVRSGHSTNDPDQRAAYDMLLQSVAGLAAKATNEGRNEELVWVDTGNIDTEDWLARRLKRQPQIELRGTLEPWALVNRYVQRGIVKGYFLYRADTSRGEPNDHRRGIDCSVNVATSLAGLFDGIIVEERLEPLARAYGLRLLMDVRNKTQEWCFETYKHRFNRAILCTQDPRKPNVRDVAIAQKAFTMFGDAKPLDAVMPWLAPLSPILGWNGGDEFKTTALSSRWGHLQTSTDWGSNLPVLMAGTEKIEPGRVKPLDPRTLDWTDARSAVSFISTDGDNVQWFAGNFFRSREGASYWGNPLRGKIPFGWSCCFAHLTQLCPEATDYALATQTANDSFVEWGGGYYYPELFGADRANRWELLAQHARRTWATMHKSQTRVIGFNVGKFDSRDAQKAYEVFARETSGLLGILVFQYDRYEAGAGRIFWVKDRDGADVPVVSARYSIWNHTNARARSGTPAKIAREIRQTVEDKKAPAGSPRYDWVIAHAWSWFRPAPGTDEDAENLPQENAGVTPGAARGYTPVTWCAERLPTSVRIVSPEELLWRIRMQYGKEQTQKLIQSWSH